MIWSDRVFDALRDFDEMRTRMRRTGMPSSAEFPALNLWVAEDKAVVTAEIPGINPDGLEISVVKDSLTLRGSRRAEELGGGESYHRRERWQGQFTRTVKLPFPVESEKVEACFAKGVLSVTLPRAEAEKPRKITIKSE